MSVKKHFRVFAGSVLAAALLSACVTAVLVSGHYRKFGFAVLGSVCHEIIEKQPEARQAVLMALKERKESPQGLAAENIVRQFGYKEEDFFGREDQKVRIFAVVGFLTGGLLAAAVFWFWRGKQTARIRALTDYLKKVNDGGDACLLREEEDDFSKLRDEIYKTVTGLRQTRDEALRAKRNFADNLYNIAHQIKTPVTSISLCAQLMEEDRGADRLGQIRRQAERLSKLEEELLLLSRIDAGTLALERKETDVFTLLTLAADNLNELFLRENVTVDVREAGEAVIFVDPEWTMEAVMNLLKNCMEHTAGGTVSCAYEQNPLYAQVRIWDTGAGFAKEDIPHLFERFYRGKNEKSGGTGIGLAISKAILESQNATVTAENRAEGGACFEIRFYCH